METKQSSQKSLTFLLKSFTRSLHLFLRETGLHGLKFVGDPKLNNWERSFFFVAFVAAFVMTCQLITNIYVKWDSTPVIIGISPHATSILKVPFPAVTICNMNQVMRSKVQHYREGTPEYEVLQLLCNSNSENGDEIEQETTTTTTAYPSLAKSDIKIPDFVRNHSQSCEEMLKYCRFSGVEYDCDLLFKRISTDEGLCCVYNFLPFEFLYKPYSIGERNLTTKLGQEPVGWDPESGYPAKLPKLYYPSPAVGTGITMGLTVVLDAQISEYFCSSTNGPGFKILLHNPITIPKVKEEGLVLGIGYETNFRLAVSRSEAMPTIRGINRNDRQCLFKNEKKLLYYKVYSHSYCENECQAMFLYKFCSCIPHNYPRVYENASVCSIRETACIRQALLPENRGETASCRKECLPSCFDLSYTADALYFPLAKRDFLIANKQLAQFNKTYLLENIAVMNVYYRESAYHGSMKNVYIGLTEFLSNIGGVMGLFMGFSVISIAEMLYFLVLKPISELLRWKRNGQIDEPEQEAHPLPPPLSEKNIVWHTNELYPKRFASRKSRKSKLLAIRE